MTDEKDISNLLESKLRLFKEAMSGDSTATKEERCNEFIMMQKKNMAIISSLQDDNLILQQVRNERIFTHEIKNAVLVFECQMENDANSSLYFSNFDELFKSFLHEIV